MFAVRSTPKFSSWIYIPDFIEYQKRKRKLYIKFTGNDHDWDIFEACAVSIKAQKEISRSAGMVKTLTYGEINFESIASIIHMLKYEYGALNKGNMNNFTCHQYNENNVM
jgi:hypothetical protein